jgi:hypothetical protein
VATTAAIALFSQTLVNLLAAGLSPGLVASDRILVATPDDFPDYANPNTPAISVFLYRVALHPEQRNLPWRQRADGSRIRPSLPLELGFLITAWAKNTNDEHLIIGHILQTLYDRAEIGSADLLNPPAPQAPAWEHGDSVQLILDSMPMEDHLRLWDSVDMPYRLSLTYLARVIGIEPGESQVIAPVIDADFRPGRWQTAEIGS